MTVQIVVSKWPFQIIIFFAFNILYNQISYKSWKPVMSSAECDFIFGIAIYLNAV